MRRPPWLHELREMVTLQTAEERQRALTAWETRWVLDVHVARLVTEADIGDAAPAIPAHLGADIRGDLGWELARLMGEFSLEAREFLAPAKVVHGGAWAIRREPKTDD